MGFIKELQLQPTPFVVKGNFSDPYLTGIVNRILSDRFNLIEIDRENMNRYLDFEGGYLFETAKPDCYIIDDNGLKISLNDLRLFMEKSSVFITAWNKKLPLDVPEINIPRLSMGSQTLGIVREWSEYLGYDIKLNHADWKIMYRSSYDVMMDIEKTLLAYESLDPSQFLSVTAASGSRIQLTDLYKALLTGDAKEAFIALDMAWNTNINLEKSLEWFNVKIDNFLTIYHKGETLESSIEKAQLTGLLKRLVEQVYNKIDPNIVDKIWKALHENSRYPEKAKDILIVLDILGK